MFKYLLLVGEDEEAIFSLFPKEDLCSAALNVESSPPVGVLIEHPVRTARELTKKAREMGIKVGTYDSRGKGVEWLHKVLDLEV